MAKVICDMNCKHKSKEPLKTYKYRSGEKCYGCTLDAISITIIPPAGNEETMIGKADMAHCVNYEPVED